MVRIPGFNAGGWGGGLNSIPGGGTEILQGAQHSGKREKKEVGSQQYIMVSDQRCPSWQGGDDHVRHKLVVQLPTFPH